MPKCAQIIYTYTLSTEHIFHGYYPVRLMDEHKKKREWIYLDVELKLVVWDTRARPQSTYNQQWNEWREKKNGERQKIIWAME